MGTCDLWHACTNIAHHIGYNFSSPIASYETQIQGCPTIKFQKYQTIIFINYDNFFWITKYVLGAD